MFLYTKWCVICVNETINFFWRCGVNIKLKHHRLGCVCFDLGQDSFQEDEYTVPTIFGNPIMVRWRGGHRACKCNSERFWILEGQKPNQHLRFSGGDETSVERDELLKLDKKPVTSLHRFFLLGEITLFLICLITSTVSEHFVITQLS